MDPTALKLDRVLRCHGCPCGFRNEFPVETVPAGETPEVDFDELEVCPGCSKLVPVTHLIRIPVRHVDRWVGPGG